jgi:hypothetical protein
MNGNDTTMSANGFAALRSASFFMKSRDFFRREWARIASLLPSRMCCIQGLMACCFLCLCLRSNGQNPCAGEGPNALRRLSEGQVYRCVEQENLIQFATISGPGLLAAFNKLSVPLRIRDSVIEDGLDFSQLKRSQFKPESVTITPPAPEPSEDTGSTKGRRRRNRAPRTAKQAPDTRGLERTLRALGALHPFNSMILVSHLIDIRNSKIEPMQKIDVENGAISLNAVGVMFLQSVNFNGSTFEGGVRLSNSAFLDIANFVGTKFLSRVSFDSAWFNRRTSFAAARFGETALLPYTRFADLAVFRAAEFNGLTAFDNARFCNSVDMTAAHFTENAQFPSILGAGDFDLSGASFPKGANFVRAQFAGTVNLTDIQSESLIAFTSAGIGTLNIGSATGFSTTLISSTLDFTGANINATRLQDAVFVRPVSFSTAHLGQPVVARDVFRDADTKGNRRMADSAGRFGCAYKDGDPPSGTQDDAETIVRRATFRDNLSFDRVTFRGKTSLSEITFAKPVDMNDALFRPRFGLPEPEVHFARLHADNLDLNWRSMPEMSAFTLVAGDPPVSSMVKELIDGYRARNRSDDLLQAKRALGWIEWREARTCLFDRSRVRSEEPDESCKTMPAILTFIALPFWGASSGFGTSLVQLLGLILVIDIAFAGIYCAWSRIVETPSTAAKDDDSSLRLRPLERPSAYIDSGSVSSGPAKWEKFLKAVALSTAILLRFGTKTARVERAGAKVNIRAFVIAEWWVGILLMLDLVYTLQSQPFIQDIIHGLTG